MITIDFGNKTIYEPANPNLQLVNPVLHEEDNTAGYLTFKIYDTNLNYGSLKKLYPLLEVKRNKKTIFKGRIVSDVMDFYNGRSIEADGKLSFLNDTVLEPFVFSGSPYDLFKKIIDNHNEQAEEWQRFKVGVVTVEDPNDYIVRESEYVLKSWEVLKTRCFDSSLGGHIRVRYEDDGDYIDWVDDYDNISSQGIAFAKNLIDLSLTIDATNTYTAMRPVGAVLPGTEGANSTINRVDITSVNNGLPYIVNEAKKAEYGVIFAPESESTWDDVTEPANLLKKAREKLDATLSLLKETYDISAVDLNVTDEEIEALAVGEYIPVKSAMHNIDGAYLLKKATIYIAAPQNSTYILGATRRTLADITGGTIVQGTGQTITNVSDLNNDAGYVTEDEVEQKINGAEEGINEKFDNVNQRIDEIVVGSQGPPGADGKDGVDGTSATVTAGEVFLIDKDQSPRVENVGTDTEAVFDFYLPEPANRRPWIDSDGILHVTAGWGYEVDADGIMHFYETD